MPPKKAKASKGPPEPVEAPLDPPDRHKFLELQLHTLQRKYMLIADEATETRAAENEIRQRVMQMQKDLKEEQQRTIDIMSDMTRQYKAMQEELLGKINNLETTLSQQKRELDGVAEEQASLRQARDEAVSDKDKQIGELKEKIDTMASQFAEMLKDTLDKMSERIEITSAQWEEEEDDAYMSRKLDELNMGVPSSSTT
eukprot:GILI01014081.1.p1 GENE.GILI01014081.1~~GILI01014081.1.p1  ORF type:complete len:214 (-),score=46.89 GILI01014081.1:97-693(-)